MKRILTLALVVCASMGAQNAALMPLPQISFLDSNGAPLAGGYLRTCVAGTACSALHAWSTPSNPLATYTDSTATVPAANPIVLDSAGSASVWLGASAYKIVLTDANGVTIWTQDNVKTTIPGAAAFGSAAVSGNMTVGGNLTVSGNATINYNQGSANAVTRTVQTRLQDTLSLKDFGCVGNGVTDDTACVVKAIAAANAKPGSTLRVPCAQGERYLVTSTIAMGAGSYRLLGDDHRYCAIDYNNPTTSQNAAFNFVGSDSIDVENLELYSIGSAHPPSAVVMLGRSSSGAYGHHNFNRINIDGYASSAMVYSIASEENTWDQLYININGGTAIHGFHTSSWDDLGICGATPCTTQTNLSLWMSHFHIADYRASAAVDSALVFDTANITSGDHVFRDGYTAAKANEWGFRFEQGTSSYLLHVQVLNVRSESGYGQAGFFKSAASVDAQANFIGFVLRDNTAAGQSTYRFYSGPTVHLFQFVLDNNNGGWSALPGGVLPDSYDYLQYSWIHDGSGSPLTVRSLANMNHISYLGSTAANLVLPAGSYQNEIQTIDRVTKPALLLSGTNGLPAVHFNQTGDPGTPTYGDMWLSSNDGYMHIQEPLTTNGQIVTSTYFKVGASSGVTTTVTCTGGQHVSGITVVGGIVTAVGGCS